MSAAAPFELFHVIADASSARVRRFVSDGGFESDVRFRNLTYPEVRADFEARGGVEAPALWDAQAGRLISGAEAIISRLKAHSDVGRES